MIALALLLGMLGVADLVRSRDSRLSGPVVVRSLLAGLIVLGLSIWGAGLPVWWFFIGLAVLVLWTVLTSAVLERPAIHPWPIVGLAVTILVLLAAQAEQPTPRGWLVDWYSGLGLAAVEGVAFERFALAGACLVFVLESANIIVRMMVTGSSLASMANEDTLKGGRILGPIERVFILSMGLAGELLAVAAVVAAKGILRFPEISGDNRGTKAEYVLVGSFISWGLALLWLPLLK